MPTLCRTCSRNLKRANVHVDRRDPTRCTKCRDLDNAVARAFGGKR